MLKDVRLIIFDLDGTLIDAYPAIIKSFNYTMQKLGYPRQKALLIRRSVGWGDENLLKPFIKIEDLKRAVSLYRKHHKTSLIRNSRLIPKARFLLSRLKDKGYKLAIASNRPTKFSWILIHHLRLEKYLNFVLCADRLKRLKPHPEILKEIIGKFSLGPEEAFYVGDMAIDAQAGRRAKIKTAIVIGGSSSREEIEKERPFLIINNIVQLLKLF